MEQKHKRNWLEQLVLLLGVLLVFTTLGVLVYDALTRENIPAEIVLSYDSIQRKQEHYTVHIIAKNQGGITAQDVLVEVTLGEGRSMETAQLQFPYIPGKSSVNGWAVFSGDPSKAPLNLKILGYSVP